MIPITITFMITGLIVWLNAFYFLGIAANKIDRIGHPAILVGFATLVAGVLDLLESIYLMWIRPIGDDSLPLAGFIVIYGFYFIVLGYSEMTKGDIRVVGTLSIPVGVLPFAWWNSLPGEWMLRSLLVVWLITFVMVTLTTYRKLHPQVLGSVLIGTAICTWLPALFLATGNSIP